MRSPSAVQGVKIRSPLLQLSKKTRGSHEPDGAPHSSFPVAHTLSSITWKMLGCTMPSETIVPRLGTYSWSAALLISSYCAGSMKSWSL